ncbi:MAG: hypothetical protein QOE66_993, partial [Chloroflexota bacterium]|nr:hypothetical protein [Chloroflexota bacterium]
MTITSRPTSAAPSLLGGSIELTANACRHGDQPIVTPWTGETGT